MQQSIVGNPADPAWLQHCDAAGLDPQRRMASRLAVLGDCAALDGTLYRAEEQDDEAEEEELGDARILFLAAFQAAESWSPAESAQYFDDLDPGLFVSALIECLAQAGSANFFVPEIGDIVASMTADGRVQMYFVHDCSEDERGMLCVLVRDDQPLF